MKRQTNSHRFRAITSHLQTMGSTVVAGTNEAQVNQMVDTMSLFLSPSERKRCSHVVPGRGYVSDLMLQGVVGVSRSSAISSSRQNLT